MSRNGIQTVLSRNRKSRCVMVYALAPAGMGAAEANRLFNSPIADERLPRPVYHDHFMGEPGGLAIFDVETEAQREALNHVPPPRRFARRRPSDGIRIQSCCVRRTDFLHSESLSRGGLGAVASCRPALVRESVRSGRHGRRRTGTVHDSSAFACDLARLGSRNIPRRQGS